MILQTNNHLKISRIG